jgi:hypothetical protein
VVIARTLTSAMISLAVAAACTCSAPSVGGAKKLADVVFRGVIANISGGRVSFRVSRVWKGNVGRLFEMPEFRETSACLGFWPDHLRIGNDLLVYAYTLPRGSKSGTYFTDICSRTSLSKNAREDFRKLGTGWSPRESRARK